MSGMLLIGGLLIFVFIMAAGDWRKGLLACIPIGFLQDPIRKITPGEPVWMVVAVTAAMGIVFLIYLAQARRRPVPILMEPTPIRNLLVMFLLLVMAQAVHTLLAYNAVMLAALGVLFYFAPLPALALSSDYPRNTADLRRFLSLYVAFSTVVGATVTLAWLGVDSPFLAEVGEGLEIYDMSAGRYILAYSGIMRSPEVAAWHLGTGACFALILLLSVRSRMALVLWTLLALFLLTAGLLTGRRKMLMELVLFVTIFSALALMFRSGAAWKSLLVGVILGLGLFFVVPLFDESELVTMGPDESHGQSIDPYLMRGRTTFSDAGERMTSLGLGSIYWAYSKAGFFGAGAGAAAQGGQHFGGQRLGGVGEGGLGRIMGELGFPGLFLVLLTGWLIFLAVFRRLKTAHVVNYRGAAIALGFVAFLGANVPIFVAAAQVYSDPFVLFVVACSAGFVLRILAPLPTRPPVPPRAYTGTRQPAQAP